MNQIYALLYSLVDSRKDNRTTIGTVLAVLVLYLNATGKLTDLVTMASLTYIGVLTGVNVAAIAHEDHGESLVKAAEVTATATVAAAATAPAKPAGA